MLNHSKQNAGVSRVARYSSGFSLIEMAMVLLILGLILNGLLVAIGESTTNRRRIDATTQLEQIQEALYGFAQVNGRLPCPANLTSSGSELYSGVSTDICASPRAFLPGVTLGIQGSYNTAGLLLDPWGFPYRYVVSELTVGGTRVFTNKAALQSWFGGAATAGSWLRVCDSDNCAGLVLSSTVPAIVYSLGADGASFTSAVQLENAGPAVLGIFPIAADDDFAITQYSEDATAYFDDILVWLSPSILTARLVNAGKLP